MAQKVSRNSPCPCGSGRKYKRCCLDKDLAAARDRAGEAIDPADVWEADIIPLAVQFDDAPRGRPTLTLVTADGMVIETRVDVSPLAEPEAIATHIESVVVSAAGTVGHYPAFLEVRHDEVALALAPRLADRDIIVRHGPLIEWDIAARAVHAEIAETDHWPTFSAPESWFAWGLPPALIEALFAAAAALYRADPWDMLMGLDPVRISLARGAPWIAVPDHAGGDDYGVSFFADPDDLYRADADGERPDWTDVVILLAFRQASHLPRRLRREIASRGWPLAATDAYPTLMVFNSPAGGISADLATRLIVLIDALSGFVEAGRGILASGNRAGTIGWSDPDGSATVTFRPRGPFTWPLPLRYSPSLPRGPGALPAAVLVDESEVDRYLEGLSPLIEAFADMLVDTGLKPATITGHVNNVTQFIAFLAEGRGVPLAAANELDFRIFIYEWLPLAGFSSSRLEGVRTSLRKFIRWLAGREGILFPWADPILDDSATFIARASRARWECADGSDLWAQDLVEDLSLRAMLPEAVWDSGPPDESGPVETALVHSLDRAWMIWRDQLIDAGIRHSGGLLAGLLDQQAEWAETVIACDPRGRSIEQLIADERAGRLSPADTATLLGHRDPPLVAPIPRQPMDEAALAGLRIEPAATSSDEIRPEQAGDARRIWRLYVAVDGIDPPVWRRIDVPGRFTMRQLHHVLQLAFGWYDAHPHAFRIGTAPGRMPDREWFEDMEETDRLCDVLPEVGTILDYEYDFGDSWQHTVQVEAIFEPDDPGEHPRVVGGGRACPPEDCGGPWAYADMLEAVSDPAHPDHEHLTEWLGPFDPDHFDRDASNARLAPFRPAPADRRLAADNVRAVTTLLGQVAAAGGAPAHVAVTAGRLVEAHADAVPGDIARLRKPSVWAAAALMVACRSSGDVSIPTAAELAARFGVSVAAVASRARLLRRHTRDIVVARPGDHGRSTDPDDTDPDQPGRRQLRLL